MPDAIDRAILSGARVSAMIEGELSMYRVMVGVRVLEDLSSGIVDP